MTGHDLEEIHEHGRHAATQDFVDQSRFLFRRDEYRVQNGFQLGETAHHFGHDGVELLDHSLRLAGPLGRIEQALA